MSQPRPIIQTNSNTSFKTDDINYGQLCLKILVVNTNMYLSPPGLYMFTPELQIFSIQLPLILNVNYCKHWYTKPAYSYFIGSDSHPSISKTNACAPDFHICYQIKLSEVWWKFGIDVKTVLVLQMDLFQGETCCLNSFGRLSLWKHLYLMAKTCHQTFYSLNSTENCSNKKTCSIRTTLFV